jgi:hypothetical protein
MGAGASGGLGEVARDKHATFCRDIVLDRAYLTGGDSLEKETDRAWF